MKLAIIYFCPSDARHGKTRDDIVKSSSLILTFLALASLSNSHAADLDSDEIRFTMRLGNQHFNTINATGTFLVLSGVPKYEAVLVTPLPGHNFVRLSPDDYTQAKWTPYDGIIRMSLGPKDGDYQVELALKGEAPGSQTDWIGTIVTLIRTPPQITITNPTNPVVTQPYLQLQGYSAMPLKEVTYDLNGVTNRRGFIIGHTLDTNTHSYTADYFQCYDLLLTNGVNHITLHTIDPAGNVFTTNFTATLNYSAAGNPVIQVIWPQDGMDICGDGFTLRGKTDDATAIVTAVIMDTNGNTVSVNGSVERDGTYWVEDLPLHDGKNRLTLTVKNTAGLSSTTNITVARSPFVLIMDPVKGSLWLPKVTVTGFESDGTHAVWVNGVKATVLINADGTGRWMAHDVPVTPGGVASFDMRAYGPNEIQPDGTYADGRIVTTNKTAANFVPHSSRKTAIQDSAGKGTALTVMPVQPVSIRISQSGGTFFFTWNAIPHSAYQLQYTSELTSTNWLDLGSPITAHSNLISTTDSLARGTQRFYRVRLVQ